MHLGIDIVHIKGIITLEWTLGDLIDSNIHSGNGLVLSGWISVDQEPWHLMASLGHNELKA